MKLKLAACMLVSALAAGLAYFLVPPVDYYELSLMIGLAFGLAIAVIEVGALWFFLSSLKTFKRDLKVAYYLLATGFFLFGLFTVQLPLLLLIGNNVVGIILQLIILIFPYLVGPLVMYLGMRKFAKLLKVHFRLTSVWLALALAVALMLGSWFLPYFPQENDTLRRAVISTFAWGAGFSIAAALVASRIRRALAPAYQSAMKWLVAALAMLAFSSIHEVMFRTVAEHFQVSGQYVGLNFSVWPYLMTAILFLVAGMRFKQVGQMYGTVPSTANELDTVIYAAGLVSYPAEVDPILNELRTLTASKKGGKLSSSDISTLVKIYLKLEQYLAAKELLRQIDRDDLRARLPQSFQQHLAKTI